MIDVDARHHDLLFLLGLAPLALGCSVGVPDDGTNFTSANPSTPPGGDVTGDSATEGESDADEGTTGAAEGSASASITASASASVGDDGSTSGVSASASLSVSASASVSVGDDYATSYGGPPPGGSPCEGYAYVVASCYYGGDPAEMAMLAENCEAGYAYYSMMYGPACGAAFEDTRACISMLSCQELAMYGMGICDQEAAAFNAACA
jgi:hypothetical protein